MPYVRDEEAMFGTGDDELFEGLLEDDEEKWEEPEWAAEAAPPRYRRGAVPLPYRPRPFRPVGGATGARIQTPAGQAQVHFPKPVATQEAVNAMARELKAEIASLAASIKKVNQTLDQNTAIVDKKINLVSTSMKKSGEMSPMLMMLPLLLQKPPTFTQLRLHAIDPATGTAATSTSPPPDFTQDVGFIVDNQAVTQDSTTMPLLLMMMMMGGGMGGSGTNDNNMMMMMMMVLLLSGGFGK